MIGLLVCVAALLSGLLVQRMQRYYIISFLGTILAFILPTLLCNSLIMDNIGRYTGLPDIILITATILYSSGTSISFLIFKVLRIKKMEHHISYANEFINEKIQYLLDDIRKEFLGYKKYYGEDLFVSLYFVKRTFFDKVIYRIVRIGHSGMPGILSEPNWNGIINRYKNTSTGKTVLLQTANVINFSEIDDSEYNGLPGNILNWSKQNIIYRINIPIKKNEKDSRVVLVLSINCIDKNFSWDKTSYSERKIQMTYAHKIIKNYKKSLAGLYNFLNCIY